MKTLLLFHRANLTDFYILLAKYLKNNFDIVHVAFSDKEAVLLDKAGIRSYYNYSKITSELFDNEILNEIELKEIDEILLKNTNQRFNLNNSIQSDRGFSLLSYSEALLSAQVHYKCWKIIFSEKKIDFMLHEPCSLFFNHIGAVMCKNQGGMFIWQSQVISDKGKYCYLNLNEDNYACFEIEKNYRYYLMNPDKINITRCQSFIDNFRKDFNVFLGELYSKRDVSVFECRIKVLKSKIKNIVKRKDNFDKLKDNIDCWLQSRDYWKMKLDNLKDYRRDKIVFEEMPKGEKFFYYSLHTEPEAVVLYLGDGLYTNQIKLIENIASSLPPGYYLYVKDHPRKIAFRASSDYKRLMQIPNVRLLKQSIPGKEIIKDAKGVFTINGTAGFEALLLDKQVYCFGWNYYCYCSRVNYIHNIRDLKKRIYDNVNKEQKDDKSFYAYINAYLDATHTGYINYFSNFANIYCNEPEENARLIAQDFINYTNKLS